MKWPLRELGRELSRGWAYTLTVSIAAAGLLLVLSVGASLWRFLGTYAPAGTEAPGDVYSVGHTGGTVFGLTRREAERLKGLSSAWDVAWSFDTAAPLRRADVTTAARTAVEIVSRDFFRVIRPKLIEGRYPSTPDECMMRDQAGAPARTLLGSPLIFRDRPLCTVVGVSDARFTGSAIGMSARAWISAEAYFGAVSPQSYPNGRALRLPDFPGRVHARASTSGNFASELKDVTAQTEGFTDVTSFRYFGIDARSRNRALRTLADVGVASIAVCVTGFFALLVLLLSRWQQRLFAARLRATLGVPLSRQVVMALGLGGVWLGAAAVLGAAFRPTVAAIAANLLIPQELRDAFLSFSGQTRGILPIGAVSAVTLVPLLVPTAVGAARPNFGGHRSSSVGTSQLLWMTGIAMQTAFVTWALIVASGLFHRTQRASLAPSGIAEAGLSVIRLEHTTDATGRVLASGPPALAVRAIEHVLRSRGLESRIEVMTPAPYSTLSAGETWSDSEDVATDARPIRSVYVSPGALELLEMPGHLSDDQVIAAGSPLEMWGRGGVVPTAVFRDNERRGPNRARYAVAHWMNPLSIVSPGEMDPPTLFLKATELGQVQELIGKNVPASPAILEAVNDRLRQEGIATRVSRVDPVSQLRAQRFSTRVLEYRLVAGLSVAAILCFMISAVSGVRRAADASRRSFAVRLAFGAPHRRMIRELSQRGIAAAGVGSFAGVLCGLAFSPNAYSNALLSTCVPLALLAVTGTLLVACSYRMVTGLERCGLQFSLMKEN